MCIRDRDELEYYREIQLLQEFTVTLELAGMSPDGMRWRLRHEVLRSDGKICAKITSIGGCLLYTSIRWRSTRHALTRSSPASSRSAGARRR